MPATALIPLISQCRVCGHPIRWTHSHLAVSGREAVVPRRFENSALTTCPGGCCRPVSDRDHPCDTCWDRLPAGLRRGLLLSLVGVEVSSARTEVAAYFRDHSPPEHSIRPPEPSHQTQGATT